MRVAALRREYKQAALQEPPLTGALRPRRHHAVRDARHEPCDEARRQVVEAVKQPGRPEACERRRGGGGASGLLREGSRLRLRGACGGLQVARGARRQGHARLSRLLLVLRLAVLVLPDRLLVLRRLLVLLVLVLQRLQRLLLVLWLRMLVLWLRVLVLRLRRLLVLGRWRVLGWGGGGGGGGPRVLGRHLRRWRDAPGRLRGHLEGLALGRLMALTDVWVVWVCHGSL